MRRSGRMKDGDWGLLIANYGKKEEKEWLDNTVTIPDPHPCTAGNKEEEHKFPNTTEHWHAPEAASHGPCHHGYTVM